MISSRRLAREWALKILYQVDVGKTAPEEAMETALEQLRREFVHRGSRSPSGSPSEEKSLELLTCALKNTLPTMRLPLERALVLAIGRLFEEIPYWQEVRVEKAFKAHAPGVALRPAYLLAPLPDSAFLLAGPASPAITPTEQDQLANFVRQAREETPRLLEPEFRKAALPFAKETAALLAGLPPSEDRAKLLLARRQAFNQTAAEHWNKVGSVVQKQTGDWLRTASFVVKLVHGVLENRKAIDHRISSLSSGWKLDRQVAVDRNIMRIAAFEMIYLPAIPTGVTINEAVELAKKYSTAESGRFVNGVLGTLGQKIGDKLTPPAEAGESDVPDTDIDLPEIVDLDENA